MEINQEEALRIIIAITCSLGNMGLETIPEDLGEIKLLRRIGKEIPDLQSHVELAFEEILERSKE